MPDSELTDLSLLLFADLGVAQKRMQPRINTLLQSQQGRSDRHAPKALQALERAGWLTVRRIQESASYCVEMTDQGLAVHRRMVAALREAVNA